MILKKILQLKKNRRLIKQLRKNDDYKLNIKDIPGGVIAQEKDTVRFDDLQLKVAGNRALDENKMNDIRLAWTVCKHVKSNAIVFAKSGRIVGVGAGQMSRLDSARLAAAKAKEFGFDLTGAVAASDAFFPFADGVEEIASNGITEIIQPGGSIRDNEVIEASNKLNLTMIFTGIRNFKH